MSLAESFHGGLVSTQDINPKAFGDKLLELSVNILGGGFVVEDHGAIRQLEPATYDWDGKTVEMSKYRECYTSRPDDCPDFFFRISDLHNRKMVYPRSFNKGAKGYDIVEKALTEKLYKLKPELRKDNTYLIRGKYILRHKPNFLNYWHFQIHHLTNHTPTDEETKKERSAWEHAVKDNLREALFDTVILDVPKFKKLPKPFYMNIQTKMRKGKRKRLRKSES